MKSIYVVIVFLSILSMPTTTIFATLPDISIQPTDIDSSDTSPTEGEQIDISVHIQNIGASDIPQDFQVRFIEGNPKADGLQIGKDVLITGGLAVGEKASAAVKWTAGAGNVDIYVLVDPNNKISESKEDNNQTYKTIQVRPWRGKSVTQTRITRAIAKGLRWLREQQKDGAWIPNMGPRPTAFAVMAFLYLNPDESNPVVRTGLDYLFNNTRQRLKEDNPYNLSIEILTLTATGNKSKYYNRVAHATQRLLESDWGDTFFVNASNIQHAVLALHAAKLWGVEITEKQWTKVTNWLIETQRNDGGWAGSRSRKTSGIPSSSTGAMTAAAVMGLKTGGIPSQNRHLQQGMEWLRKHFSVVRNPGANYWHFHYLVALQRAMTIPPEQDLLGEKDWYEEGASYLISSQQSDGSWYIAQPVGISQQKSESDIAVEYSDVMTTSLALMFLLKYKPSIPLPDLGAGALQPIVFSKTDPKLGERLKITATIANIGKVDTESVEVKFFDGEPQTDGMQIGPAQTIPSLTAGEQATVSTIWTANSNGIHQIFVVIDALNSIKESNETNNVFSADINVEGRWQCGIW